MGTHVSEHKRVWAQSCGHNFAGSSMYGQKRVVSAYNNLQTLRRWGGGGGGGVEGGGVHTNLYRNNLLTCKRGMGIKPRRNNILILESGDADKTPAGNLIIFERRDANKISLE